MKLNRLISIFFDDFLCEFNVEFICRFNSIVDCSETNPIGELFRLARNKEFDDERI